MEGLFVFKGTLMAQQYKTISENRSGLEAG
jgi:hypothetical protein